MPCRILCIHGPCYLTCNWLPPFQVPLGRCRCNVETEDLSVEAIVCCAQWGVRVRIPCENTMLAMDKFVEQLPAKDTRSLFCQLFLGNGDEFVGKYTLTTKLDKLRGEFQLEVVRFRVSLSSHFRVQYFDKLLGEEDQDDMQDPGIQFQLAHKHKNHFAAVGKQLKILKELQKNFLDPFAPQESGSQALVYEPTREDMKAKVPPGSWMIDSVTLRGHLEDVINDIQCTLDETLFDFGGVFDPKDGWAMVNACRAVQEAKILPRDYTPRGGHNSEN